MNEKKDEIEIQGPLTSIIYEKVYYEDDPKEVLEFRDSFGSTFLLSDSEIDEFIDNFRTFMEAYGCGDKTAVNNAISEKNTETERV
jgi:septation ring formation regulator EzrA